MGNPVKSPTDQYINNAQNNPVDYVKALTDLLVVAPQQQQQAAQMLDAQQRTIQARQAFDKATAQQQQLHPVQQAALDGVIAATKKQASEAVMQAGPEAARHIIDTYVYPDQKLTFSLPGQEAPVNNSQQVFASQPTIQDMQNKVQQNILQQLISSTQQPQGVLQGFLHGFAQGTGYTKGNLENLNSAATAAGLVQEQAGLKPIQPTDVAKMNRETYANTLSGVKSQLENNQKTYGELNQQLKTLEENRNPLEKTMGGLSGEQKSILEQMQAIANQNVEHTKNLRILMLNAPKALSESTKQNASTLDPALLAELKKRNLKIPGK